jgi:NodT family efflux transporter outer membrane factor (OMF) lipoprotein
MIAPGYHYRHVIRITVLSLWVLSQAGCTVGPAYTPPAAPNMTGYTHEPTPATITGSSGKGDIAQKVITNAELTADWWQLFHSAELNTIVKQALDGNPDLAAARASLRQAHEAVAAAEGALWPQIDVNAGISHQKASFVQFGEYQSIPNFNLYSLGATVGYSLDIFGANSDAVMEGKALEDIQRDEVAAAYLTLTASVISEAIIMAETREEIADVHDIISVDEKNLKLLHDGVHAGIFADHGPEVLSAESQIANDRTLLAPLLQQLNVAEHAAAALVGNTPSRWDAPLFDFSNLKLPDEVPVSLPSSLVGQRPDIMAAEAKLRASNAAIDIATADMLPHINLSADFSYNGLQPDQLFSPVGIISGIAGQLAAPIFHGGTLLAQKRGAEAAFDVARAQYESTVLEAFRQVTDTLRALEHDSELTKGENVAVLAAKKSLDAARGNLSAGTAGYLQVLDAARQYHEAQTLYIRALAQRYQDTATLFVVMGGGWWRDPDLFASSDDKVEEP